MKLSFRDRFLTPPVARAILSPLGMVLFGVGAAGGILLGAPIAVAAVAGVAGWGAQVLAAVPRGAVQAKVEPFALSEPWRSYVVDAQVSQKRFHNVVAGMSKGPIRQRLAAMEDRLDEGIDESWKIAKSGHEISQAVKALKTSAAEQELAAVRSTIGTDRAPTPSEASIIEALRSQIEAGHRLDATVEQARNRLRVLDARFDELVARAVEVSVGAGDSDRLRNDVDGLVTELEALRTAIEETTVADGGQMPLAERGQTPGDPGTSLPAPG